MNINIDSSKLLTTLLSGSLIAAFAWMWQINERVAKIESPDSMLSRVETLETLILPIAVEHEVHRRVAEITEREQPASGMSGVMPTRMNENIAPIIEVPSNPELKEAAEDSVRSKIEQRPIEEARRRRGRPIEFKNKKK